MKKFGWIILIGIGIVLYYAFDTGMRQIKYDNYQKKIAEKRQQEINYINNLEILNKDWKIDRYEYSKITFSIKNNGNLITDYLKISVRFVDKNGNIIDSTYTNTLEKILPGASKMFEVTHKTPKKADGLLFSVDEVRFFKENY